MNSVKKKTVTMNGIKYDYLLYDQSMNFVCDKCLKAKVAKKVAEYKDSNGNIKRICNSCYSDVCQQK